MRPDSASEARNDYRENPRWRLVDDFLRSAQQPIQRCKRDISKNAKNGDDIGRVGNFVRGLQDAVFVINRKYDDREGRF